MHTPPQYSFRMVRTSYKSQDLIYEEPGYKLVIYVEMSAGREFDWIGSNTSLKKWTEPKEEKISENQREEFLLRLAAWNEQQKFRIGFARPMDIGKMAGDLEKKGWKVEKRSTGVTVFSSPAKRKQEPRVD
jgi:hypothetical protein